MTNNMNNPYSRRACLPGNEVTQAVITESEVHNDELVINTSEDTIPSRYKDTIIRLLKQKIREKENSIVNLPATISAKNCLMSGIGLKN